MNNRINAVNIAIFPAIGRAAYDEIADLSEQQREAYYKERAQRLKLQKGKHGLSTISFEQRSLSQIHKAITNPGSPINQGKGRAQVTLSALTDFVRVADYDARKYYLLPHAVFAGIPGRKEERNADHYRNKEQMAQPDAVISNYIVVDFDHLEAAGVSLAALREKLAADTEIGLRLLFVSPYGDGLKAVCESKKGFANDAEFKAELKALAAYVNENIIKPWPDLKIDPSGKDICRTCFLCYDPEARLFDNNQTFDSEKHPAPIQEKPKREPVQYQAGGFLDDADAAERLVRKVEEARAAICNEEGDYFKIVTAFSALGERGRELAHRVCSLSDKYDAAQLDTDFDYSRRNYSATANIGVFFAMCKDYGLLLHDPAEMARFSPNKMNYKENYRQGGKGPETAQKPADFSKMWETESEEGILQYIGEDSGGIDTGYYVLNSDNHAEQLKLPADGLTLVCGLPGHCKSVFLRNLALRFAVSQTPGDVLYFSYEESKRKTELRLLNTFIGVELKRGWKNTDVIRDYCKTGGKTDNIDSNKLPEFNEKRRRYQELRASGRLRVYSPDYTAGELVEAVKQYQEHTGRAVSSVFVDYIQFMQSGRDLTRREDILEVATQLLNLAKTGIPVIAAAQLNREVKTPSMMNGGRIAESQDLTRHADTILCLWNSQKADDLDGGLLTQADKIKFSSFVSGTPGQVYLVVSKSRENEPGQWNFLRFDGKTGLIEAHPDGAIDDLPADSAAGGYSTDYDNFQF